MRNGARPLLAALGILLAVGCGRPLGEAQMSRRPRPSPGVIYGTLPTGPLDRPVLRALPVVATYRWGPPSGHFSGVTAQEDSLAQTFAAHELRNWASEVLRINGWREATGDETASFELSVLRVERTREWTEQRPDPRGQMPDPNSCRNRPTAQRANCVEPMPRDYPPIHVTLRATDVRVAFAIVRLSDQATAWWIAQDRTDIQIATLRLLQAGERADPALPR